METLANRYTIVNSLSPIARRSESLCNASMRTIEEIRRDNLCTLIAEIGSQRAFAELIDKQAAQVSQWVTMAPSSETGTPRAVSSKEARMIEQRFRRERGWMDHEHGAIASTREMLPDERALLEHWQTLSSAERKAFSSAFTAIHQSREGRKSA